MSAIQSLTSNLEAFASQIARMKRGYVVTLLRWLVPALFVGVIGYNLYRIGLSRVWLSPPTSPTFYVLLLLLPFLLPVADLAIYRYLWRVGSLSLLSALLRKRYMNSLVLDYSGEAYFFLWARKNVRQPDPVIAHSIKDSNVLSAGAGLATTAIIFALLLEAKGVSIPGLAGVSSWQVVLTAMVPALLCVVLVVGGRRVTTLSRLQMATVFLIHFARGASSLMVEFALWWLSGALPNAAVCLEFVALKVVIARLPLVPNKGLVFAGLAITAAGYMNVSTPRVAAVVIILSVAEQLMAVAVVGIPWLIERFGLGARQPELRPGIVTASTGAPQPSTPVPSYAPAVYDPRPD